MKSTFITAEIKIVCKIRSFIHVFKCVSGKIAGKIRLSVRESELLAKLVKTWGGFTGREVHVNASQKCLTAKLICFV